MTVHPSLIRLALKYIIAPVVIFLIFIFVLFTIADNQPTGQIFVGLVGVTCAYQVNVVAFVDSNGNGIRDTGETGVAGVRVELQHSHPYGQLTPEIAMTDSNGSTRMSADTYCAADDTLTVNVKPSAGYNATSPLSFGPYTVPEISDMVATPTDERPIPATIYVGFRPN